MFAIQIKNLGTFNSNLISQDNILKQFLLIFSPPDFNKFVYEIIKNKIKTDTTVCVIGTPTKYLKVQNSVASCTYREDICIVNNTQTPSIFTTSNLYLRASKFVRDHSEIRYSQPTAEMIKKLRKEPNDDEIDLSKLCNFESKSSRSLSLKLKKVDFIYQLHFP